MLAYKEFYTSVHVVVHPPPIIKKTKYNLPSLSLLFLRRDCRNYIFRIKQMLISEWRINELLEQSLLLVLCLFIFVEH